jgi:uncharacterized membrane protein
MDMTYMETDFCTNTSQLWQLVGYFLYIVKVVIPIIIIVLAVIDFSKAVIASKDDEIKFSLRKLLKRIILGILIFFIPTLISIALAMVKDATEFTQAASSCRACLLSPFGDECETTVSKAKTKREKYLKEIQDQAKKDANN